MAMGELSEAIAENKEKISVVETEMKWLKKAHFEAMKKMDKFFDEATEKMEKIHNIFNKGDGKINALRQDIHGNGSKGIKEQVQSLDKNFDDLKKIDIENLKKGQQKINLTIAKASGVAAFGACLVTFILTKILG